MLKHDFGKLGIVYAFDDPDGHRPYASTVTGNDALLDAVWGHLGRISLETDSRGSLNVEPFPADADKVFGSQAARLAQVTKKHTQYVRDGVSRNYLFSGPPGSGKSTFAAARFDRVRLVLRPQSVIVDDVDRCNGEGPSLMQFVETLKKITPTTAVIFTVNDIGRLPSALLRPGRVDEILMFEPPTTADREAILRGYLREFGVARDVNMPRLLELTDGMTGAYLREVALQLRYITEDELEALKTRLNYASLGK
jgi:AAA+ superfamily predicted ATPase